MQLQNGLIRSVPHFSRNTAATGTERHSAAKAKAMDGTSTPAILLIRKSFGDYSHSSQSVKDDHQQKKLSQPDAKPSPEGPEDRCHPALPNQRAASSSDGSTVCCEATASHLAIRFLCLCMTTRMMKHNSSMLHQFIFSELHLTAFPADKEPRIITTSNLPKRASEGNIT